MLTDAQKLTLKTFITNDAVMGVLPHNAQSAFKIAELLNATSDYWVWKTTTTASDIFDSITWANFTPANPAAGAGQDAANWLLACQGKQINLQTLLRDQVATGKANIRAGLQDALTHIPSGVAGAEKNGGWGSVQLVIQRLANLAEKVLATGTGTPASPGVLGFEGTFQYPAITELMGW